MRSMQEVPSGIEMVDIESIPMKRWRIAALWLVLKRWLVLVL
tara:strand:+ start:913 stop:1038 length:126 start_codon:yes stop_codon:yes gene_type:complete